MLKFKVPIVKSLLKCSDGVNWAQNAIFKFKKANKIMKNYRVSQKNWRFANLYCEACMRVW